jgi:ribosomal protein S18 acetylase RimI-like enzyme
MFFVATVDGDVVGWVHLHAPETAKLSHVAQLTAGVLSEYRGRGIGRRLLRRGVEWAKENGFERLYNSVPATNEAGIAFLESQDWEVEAVREGHYKIGGEYVDEVMLAYEL